MKIALHTLKSIVIIFLILTCNNSFSQIITKQLYLSDPSQSLDLIDPMAEADVSTAQSNLLYTDSTPITVNNYYFNKTSADASTITVPNVVVGSSENRLMLIGVSIKGTDPDLILPSKMTVKYGAQTALGIDQTPDGNATVVLFALVNPTTGTADVTVNFTDVSKKGIVVGVTNYAGVNQTTPLGNVVKGVNLGANLFVNVSSAPGELVYDLVAISNTPITAVSSRQIIFYNEDTGNEIVGASSIKPGAASVTMDWTNGGGKNNAMLAVAIKPEIPNTSETFIQSPALCNTLTIKGGETITVSNYLSIASGTMPANPSITAQLKYGGTNIITLSNPTYNSGSGLLTWTGSLGSDITVPAGQSIALKVTTAVPNVSFYIDYDSQTKPSKIEFSMDSGANIFTPEKPSVISGNISPSIGSSQNYSVVNEPGLTYNWVLPSGWTQTAGGTTNSITVTVGSLSGNITVTPNNGSCNGNVRVLSLFTATKQLYLSDPNQSLDRIDPVATADATTVSTSTLSVSSSVTLDLIATKDTGIMLKNDATNYGSCTSIDIDRESTDLQRALFQFDLSSIPAGAVIETAELRLNCTTGADMDISVFKIGNTDTWDEGALCSANGASNWIQRTASLNWTTAGVVGDSSGGTPLATINANSTGIQAWPITCLVEDWVSGAAVNNGILVGSQDGGGNRIATYDTRETTTGVKPTLRVTYSTNAVSFTQSPVFCSPFTIKAGTPINIDNYVSIVSGSMPTNPEATAILKTNCSNTIATLTNPTYNATTGLLSWSGSLVSDTTIPAGEAFILNISSAQAGVVFKIDYDSQTKPSKIEFSTSTFIEISSYKAYDAPYPGGSIITSAEAGSLVYLRSEVTDPFGAYDITDLSIDNQGTPVTGTNVASTNCSNTYEYPLFTPSTTGTYSYTATAKEGYENTVIDILSLDLTITTSKIDFDGTDDHIDFGDAHDLTGSFSLEAWILQENSVANGTILSKGNSKSGNKRGYKLAVINNYPNITWYNASGTELINLTSPYAITNNKWYHIATTFDGTISKIYIDGVKVAEVAIATPPLDGTERFIVGANYDSDTPSAPKNYFNGFIDEVRIWGVSLTDNQIREMMNQEIEQNGTFVKGKILPINISGGLQWSSLSGYYPMKENVADDKSGNGNYGLKKNINTLQAQTAPIPYTSIDLDSATAIDWDLNTTWANGSNCTIPNSIGIDGTTIIDWNIVEVKDNIYISRNLKLLGLDSNEEKLTINADHSLEISKYLKLNGLIDLEGESQLIQANNSVLDITSSGTLERDQQGTADLYTYNYWAAPVGISNTISNNNSYTLADIMKGGSNAADPNDINWITSGYNGTSGDIVGIADYWIWKYANQASDNYPSWQHVRSTGALAPGEGFTMKGTTDTGGAISTLQNYVFSGKPHNGDVTLTLSAGNDYLVGNPYASAIDADEFILDNISDGAGRATSNIIDGALYFWDHFASSTHNISEYQGGYATYTLMGGTVAISSNARINATGASGTKTPQQYIPVGQGFFVTAETGGTISFKNSQRIFKTEASDPSTFMRTAGNNKKNKNNASASSRTTNEDTRQKVRLMFDSPKGYHRQLLLGADQNATLSFDRGYDAPLTEDNVEDMYWTFDEKKYIIQGVNNFDDNSAFPIGVKISEEGEASFKIQELENIPSSIDIFLYDKELATFHDLSLMPYKINLPTGEYLERFELVFHNKTVTVTIEEDIVTSFDIIYSNSIKSIVLTNPDLKEVYSIELLNILGQSIRAIKDIPNTNYTEYKLNNISAGTYIIKMETDEGIISKKVIIE